MLLCLSNPTGPTAVVESKPPIHRLWDHLRDGDEFPTCAMAKSDQGRFIATPGFDFYDGCPTVTLAQGERAVVGTASTPVHSVSHVATAIGETVQVGIGHGDGYPLWNRFDGPRAKICVGTKVGMT